jgi:hypothetical protein
MTDNLKRIQQDIELTRTALDRLAGARDGNINCREVAQLSTRLDELIVSHVRLAANLAKKRRFE